MLFLRGEKMKITGGMNYVKFDLENGYIIKAEGEMLVGRKFVVYTDTMNKKICFYRTFAGNMKYQI